MMKDNSQSEKLLSENEEDSLSFESPKDTQSRQHQWRRWLHPQLLILVLSLLLNVGLIISTVHTQDLDRLTIKHAQRYWSPILDSIHIPYKIVLFNVTLFSNSIYREDASEEVDQAWMDLGQTATQVVSETDAARIGFTSGMVKLSPSSGSGFIAQMEVFHQLHCLDTLRQGMYFNYEYYHSNRRGVWGRSDAVVRKHMGHCLDLLRMQLQCTSDVGLMGMLWVNTTGMGDGKEEIQPFAEFRMEHRCRDFEAVKKWAVENDRKGVVRFREGDVVLDQFP